MFIGKDGELVQAHVVPLAQFDDLEHVTVAHLLPVLPKPPALRTAVAAQSDIERTREGLLRTVRRRDESIRSQLEQIVQREQNLGERDKLRIEGERIYAQLYELPRSRSGLGQR